MTTRLDLVHQAFETRPTGPPSSFPETAAFLIDVVYGLLGDLFHGRNPFTRYDEDWPAHRLGG